MSTTASSPGRNSAAARTGARAAAEPSEAIRTVIRAALDGTAPAPLMGWVGGQAGACRPGVDHRPEGTSRGRTLGRAPYAKRPAASAMRAISRSEGGVTRDACLSSEAGTPPRGGRALALGGESERVAPCFPRKGGKSAARPRYSWQAQSRARRRPTALLVYASSGHDDSAAALLGDDERGWQEAGASVRRGRARPGMKPRLRGCGARRTCWRLDIRVTIASSDRKDDDGHLGHDPTCI